MLVESHGAHKRNNAHRMSSGSEPVGPVTGVTPFKRPAGETLATAALSGSNRSESIRSITQSANESRTSISADGSENRANSCAMTAMAATLVNGTVVALKAN